VSPRRSRHRRLLLAGAVALAASGASVLSAARAALSEQAGAPALASLERLAPGAGEPPSVVVLNGQRLLVRTRTTDQSVRAVLDAFESECDTPGLSAPRPERWLMARHADPDGSVGQSACFARSDARSSTARLWDFVRDGDLSRLGQPRYVLARRGPGAAGTHVLEIWAPGTLSLRALLDAPDAQTPADDRVPAPAQAELLLEARVEGQPLAVHLYTSPEPPLVLLERYTRQLVASGFEALPSPDDGHAPSRAVLGPQLATVLTTSRVGDQTLLARVELARPRHVALAEVAP
jgi:hypothetical protein